jgi:putative hemolysin
MLMLQLSIVLLLILVNGFFSMAEIALLSARKARLQMLADRGGQGARMALELKQNPSRLLSTVQIGITVIAVLSGTFGQATLGERLEQELLSWSGPVARYAHPISMAGVVIAISYVSLILGELVPKRIALVRPQRIAAGVGRIMRAMARVGAPIAWLLGASTDLVLRLLPLRGGGAAPVTDEEISLMLREGAAAGHIHQAETEIVEMALRLGDRRISAAMTPRTQIEWLDLDDLEEENRRKLRDSGHSRFPVVQGDQQQGGHQQVVGIVRAKDLLSAMLAGQRFDLRAAIRPPLYLPNTVTVLRALEVFKTSAEPLALVVDEYGDLEGLVALNDMLEALVGDIDADRRMVGRDDGTWLIDGMVGLDELKQVLGVSRLSGEDLDFHTLGGYVMARLNRVPMIADQVIADGYRFEVVAMDGRRVERVLVSPVTAKTQQ